MTKGLKLVEFFLSIGTQINGFSKDLHNLKILKSSYNFAGVVFSVRFKDDICITPRNVFSRGWKLGKPDI
jgi:hypothetical protein